jgi:hypothetical protein
MFRAKRSLLVVSSILCIIGLIFMLAPFSREVQGAPARPLAFAPPVDYPVGTNPVGITVGNFMGLGHQDLAVTNELDDSVSILANDGTGAFTPQPPIALAASSNPTGIITGDFTGLGHHDLAVADIGDSTVSILLNNGSGTFTLQPPIHVGPLSNPIGLAVGNFMGLGRQDIAITNQNTHNVMILANNGSGSFTAQPPIPVGNRPIGIVNGNFMGLGRQDLAVTNYNDNTVTILANNGSGTFAPQPPIAVGLIQ